MLIFSFENVCLNEFVVYCICFFFAFHSTKHLSLMFFLNSPNILIFFVVVYCSVLMMIEFYCELMLRKLPQVCVWFSYQTFSGFHSFVLIVSSLRLLCHFRCCNQLQYLFYCFFKQFFCCLHPSNRNA